MKTTMIRIGVIFKLMDSKRIHQQTWGSLDKRRGKLAG